MKAIDTNILVRILIKDDNIQAKKALDYIKNQKEVFISSVVLIEAIWVFESCYEIQKPELINIIKCILMTTQFIVEHSEAIWLGLDEYVDKNLDITDCIIGAIAKTQGHHPTITFDKKATKSKLFQLLN